jgi:hypothetical protein
VCDQRSRIDGRDDKSRLGMAEYDDINTSSVALVGFVGTMVLVAIVIVLQVAYYHVAAALFRQKDLDQPIVELETAIQAQQARLAGYHWIDKPKGVVAIPIDRAMDLVVAEAASGSIPKVQQGAAQPPSVAPPSPAAPNAGGGASDAKRK